MRRRVLHAVLGAGMWLAAMAPATSAVEPILGTPLPEEPPVVPLTERAVETLVADVDGDGVREVIAVAALEDLPGFAAVQAWWVEADGSVEPSNQVRLRRSATFDDRIAIGNGIRIDDDNMTGVRISEPAHLFTVRRGGREVVLAAGMGANPELTSPCCLTLWEVTTAGVGAIDLDLVAETNRIGIQLVVADLDGDGTDEMVVTESEASEEVTDLEVALLQWNGIEYVRSSQSFPGVAGCCPSFMAAGDSDGVAGEDVLVGDFAVVDDPESIDGGLLRLTLRDGVLVLEGSGIGATVSARVLDLPGGPAVLTAADDTTVQLWSWRRDEPIRFTDERLHRSGVPLAAIGAGADTTIIIGRTPDPDSLLVMSGDLTGSETVGADFRAGVGAALAQLDPGRQFSTFFGTIPGGVPDIPEAYAFAGRLVEPVANIGPVGSARVHEIALLPHLDLKGTAGPDGSWMAALATSANPAIQPVPTVATEAVVDVLLTGQTRPLVLAATSSVLSPESEFGVLDPTFEGVAPDPDRPVNFIVGAEAATAVIQGPPGSAVRWAAGGEPRETTISADGTARVRLLEPTEADADEASLVAQISVITPSGHAYVGAWRIRVYRQPPDLGMHEDVPLLDFAPTVSGRTLPGSTITVNGQPGTVGSDGEFSESVQVGVVPTEIRIVVTDPVGNQTQRLVSRVWPLDYRQLPWVPIAVLLTVAAGAILFLRQPESRAGRHLTPEDESTFEEIGG